MGAEMKEITAQDCNDLHDIFNDINSKLIEKMNTSQTPHQPSVNDAHNLRGQALNNWLTLHQGKVLKPF